MILLLLIHTRPTVQPALVREYPRRPVPEETFTDSHPSWSSGILYQLSPSTTIYSILLVQFTCLTALFHNISPGPLCLEPSTSYSMHFSIRSSYSFRNMCQHHRSLFCCNTNVTSRTHARTHTHTHPFNGPLSRTTYLGEPVPER